MDIRMYFQKIRDIERSIATPYVVVVSLETPEGGKAGVRTEVARGCAAQLVVDGKVRLAEPEEQVAYYAEAQEALIAANEASLADKIQLTVVSDSLNRSARPRPEKR